MAFSRTWAKSWFTRGALREQTIKKNKKKKIKKMKMNKESQKSVQKKWSTGKCHFRCARSAKRTSKIVPRQGCGDVKKSATKTEHF